MDVDVESHSFSNHFVFVENHSSAFQAVQLDILFDEPTLSRNQIYGAHLRVNVANEYSIILNVNIA